MAVTSAAVLVIVALDFGSIEIHENTDYGNRQYVLLMH